MNDETMNINGIEYIRKDLATSSKPNNDTLPYRIFRSDRAGVFAGFLESINGQTVSIIKARRLWYWEGAASLSQLAVDGTNKPDNCKFPVEVSRIILTDVIEILEVTSKAYSSIINVPIWKV